MQLIGETIRHEQFGKGVVTACDHNIITVNFPEGIKRFVYPDAFQNFLIAKDTETRDQIDQILVQQQEEEQKRHLENMAYQQKMAHLRAMKVPPMGQLVFDLANQGDNDPFATGLCSTGVYLSGYSKGESRVPQRVNFYTMCLLTGKPENAPESERRILGAAMVRDDFSGDDCTDGQIPLHEEYRLKLSRTVPLWTLLGKEPPKTWGKASFRYISNKLGAEILKEILNQNGGTPEEPAIKAFCRYYAECNRISFK